METYYVPPLDYSCHKPSGMGWATNCVIAAIVIAVIYFVFFSPSAPLAPRPALPPAPEPRRDPEYLIDSDSKENNEFKIHRFMSNNKEKTAFVIFFSNKCPHCKTRVPKIVSHYSSPGQNGHPIMIVETGAVRREFLNENGVSFVPSVFRISEDGTELQPVKDPPA